MSNTESLTQNTEIEDNTLESIISESNVVEAVPLVNNPEADSIEEDVEETKPAKKSRSKKKSATANKEIDAGSVNSEDASSELPYDDEFEVVDAPIEFLKEVDLSKNTQNKDDALPLEASDDEDDDADIYVGVKQIKEQARTVPVSQYAKWVRNVQGKRELSAEWQKRYKSYLALSVSRKGRRPLVGRVEAVEMRNGPNGDVPCAIVYLNPFKIYIPFFEFYDPPTEECAENVHVWRARAEKDITLRIGGEIDYVVTDADQDRDHAMGSRIEAMLIRREQYYVHRFKKTNETRVQEGDLIQARVVDVRTRGARLEFYGIEQYFPSQELGWNRMSNVGDHFKVGDVIDAKVMSIRRGRSNDLQVEISPRLAKKNPVLLYFDTVEMGGIYTGKVRYVSADYGIFVDISRGDDIFQVLCYVPERGPMPMPGDGVRVRIKHKDIDKGFYGDVLYVDTNWY